MSEKANSLRNSIEGVASQSTERKMPGGSQTVPPNPVQPASPTGEPSQGAKFFSSPNIKQPKTESGEQPNALPGGAIDPKLIEQSGKTGAYLAGGTIEIVFSLIERLMYLKKFTAEEKEKILEIDGKPVSDMAEIEKSLNYKFLSITKKHDKMRDKIPLDPEEMNGLEIAFQEYTKSTGKTLSPNLIIISSIVKVLCSRSIEIFLA